MQPALQRCMCTSGKWCDDACAPVHAHAYKHVCFHASRRDGDRTRFSASSSIVGAESLPVIHAPDRGSVAVIQPEFLWTVERSAERRRVAGACVESGIRGGGERKT
jgi:hypothetical protein